jgi:hypothetical protein
MFRVTLGTNGTVGGFDTPVHQRLRYNQVVIITQGRSGSSFVGELLSKVRLGSLEAMYFFQ